MRAPRGHDMLLSIVLSSQASTVHSIASRRPPSPPPADVAVTVPVSSNDF